MCIAADLLRGRRCQVFFYNLLHKRYLATASKVSDRIVKHLLLLSLSTRVGTLIVATIYLQLIQNRYMFRSFTVLQCSHQHCVQPVASDVGSRRIPLAAPVVLIVRMERSTA